MALKRIITILLFLSCLSCDEEIHRMSMPMMGTIINLTVYGSGRDAVRASDAVFTEMKRIEKLMNPRDREGDIYRINSLAAQGPVKVSAETYGLLERSIAVSKISGGAFDPTFVPLGRLWNYKAENFTPPEEADIIRTLELVDYRNIVLPGNDTVSFSKKGMAMGLGGIAKGYAVERAAALMKEMKISGIVDAGGNLKVLGSPPGRPWAVGVRHPRKEELLCTVEMADGESVATSGDYERFVMYKGKRYHHIIDPATGRPAETVASVTVITGDAERADAFSTALFVMGLQRAEKFLGTRDDLSVIIVDLKMNIHASKRLKGRLEFAEKTDVRWF